MFVESARRPFSLSGFTTSAASWSCCIVLRDVWHASDFRSRCQNPSQHAIFIIRMAYANRESLLTFACRRCESNQGFLKPCLDSAGVNIACLERWTMNEDVRSSSWTWGVFIAAPMFVCLKIRKPTMQVQQMVCRFPQKLAVLICIYIYSSSKMAVWKTILSILLRGHLQRRNFTFSHSRTHPRTRPNIDLLVNFVRVDLGSQEHRGRKKTTTNNSILHYNKTWWLFLRYYYCHFHPDPWGNNDPIRGTYFSNGLLQPPTYVEEVLCTEFLSSFGFGLWFAKMKPLTCKTWKSP